MLIEVINVQATSKPAKNGTYTQLDVAYKNKTYGDKVEGKKIMSFAYKDVYAVLAKATNGQQFEVTVTKDSANYNQWTEIKEVGSTTATSSSNPTANKGSPTPKSTYETPEERAIRQRMIVRQSSLSNAIQTLSVNPGKDKIQFVDVIQLATDYFNWVMEKDSKDSPVAMDIGNMSDDIPL
jgi:hypothetical protein